MSDMIFKKVLLESEKEVCKNCRISLNEGREYYRLFYGQEPCESVCDECMKNPPGGWEVVTDCVCKRERMVSKFQHFEIREILLFDKVLNNGNDITQSTRNFTIGRLANLDLSLTSDQILFNVLCHYIGQDFMFGCGNLIMVFSELCAWDKVKYLLDNMGWDYPTTTISGKKFGPICVAVNNDILIGTGSKDISIQCLKQLSGLSKIERLSDSIKEDNSLILYIDDCLRDWSYPGTSDKYSYICNLYRAGVRAKESYYNLRILEALVNCEGMVDEIDEVCSFIEIGEISFSLGSFVAYNKIYKYLENILVPKNIDQKQNIFEKIKKDIISRKSEYYIDIVYKLHEKIETKTETKTMGASVNSSFYLSLYDSLYKNVLEMESFCDSLGSISKKDYYILLCSVLLAKFKYYDTLCKGYSILKCFARAYVINKYEQIPMFYDNTFTLVDFSDFSNLSRHGFLNEYKKKVGYINFNEECGNKLYTFVYMVNTFLNQNIDAAADNEIEIVSIGNKSNINDSIVLTKRKHEDENKIKKKNSKKLKK